MMKTFYIKCLFTDQGLQVPLVDAWGPEDHSWWLEPLEPQRGVHLCRRSETYRQRDRQADTGRQAEKRIEYVTHHILKCFYIL